MWVGVGQMAKGMGGMEYVGWVGGLVRAMGGVGGVGSWVAVYAEGSHPFVVRLFLLCSTFLPSNPFSVHIVAAARGGTSA